MEDVMADVKRIYVEKRTLCRSGKGVETGA